ncbi:MAG: site-specific integrase [Oscillochloris sp.]|nr:site-specific integrase [Oscillochloris sp.]
MHRRAASAHALAPTLDAAVDVQRRLIDDLKAGRDPNVENPPIADYIAQWIAGRQTIKPDARRRYTQSYQHQIKPLRIGKLRLQQLTREHVRQWVQAAAELPSQDDPARTLDPYSIRNAFAVLRAALNTAVHDGLLPVNPCSGIELPAPNDGEITPLSPEEVHALLDLVDTYEGDQAHRLAALYHVAIKLGLRQGELLGLRWRDVDFRARVVRVTGQQKRAGRASGKTSKAHRSLPLTDDLIRMLRAHQLSQGEERRLMGAGFNQADLVFVSEVGTPILPRNLYRQYTAFQRRAGLCTPCSVCHGSGARPTDRKRQQGPCPACDGHGSIATYRFHDLRHTYAALALAAGVELFTLSRQMGHSSISVTADRYGRLYHGAADNAAAIERYLRKA